MSVKRRGGKMVTATTRRIAALDIGSAKVSCFIADAHENGDIRVLGVGHHLSAGVKSGMVTDLAQTERVVRAAVQQAEETAGETIEDVVVGVSAGRLTSEVMTVEVSIAGHAVEAADIEQVGHVAERDVDAADRALVHILPACYSVDDACGIQNPEGMYGEKLGLDLHLVTADAGPILNVEATVQRGLLDVAGVVAAPYAAGLACLHEQEKALGAACIDIGAGQTGISIFYGGVMVDCGVIPLGGQAITHDLARGLGTGIADAERMKTLYGSAISCSADRRETIQVSPLIDGNAALASHGIQRSRIVELIQPRLEEIFEGVAQKLRAAGFWGPDAGPVVLTGGGSQLSGLSHFAEQHLNCPVRLGYPLGLRGLAEATSGPAFTTGVGLLLYAAGASRELEARPGGRSEGGWAWPSRVVDWLRDML